MKLEADHSVATSEVPKPENEAEPDAKLLSEHLPQEARTKFKSGSGMEAEKELLGAKFLGPSPGQDLGSRQTEQLDLVVATEPEFEEVLAIPGGIYGGLDYLPSCYHIWLQDPNLTVVLAKHTREVLVRRQHSGVKVAQPSRDDQRGPRELKKYRLNTKQFYRFYRVRALPWGSQSLPKPFCQGPDRSETAPDSQLPTHRRAQEPRLW